MLVVQIAAGIFARTATIWSKSKRLERHVMADKGGLEGIVVARSRLCSIDGQKGVLIYGGYDVGDLAEHSSYEETCFLILRGRLPSRDELEAFTSDLAAASPLSDETAAVIDMPGPVYVRLKRGEIPVIFDEDHVLRLGQAEVLLPGDDVALFASGMMLAAALAAARALAGHAVSVSVINVPTVKPLDTATVQDAAARARVSLGVGRRAIAAA